MDDLARHLITFDPRDKNAYLFAEPEGVDTFHAAPFPFPEGFLPVPKTSTEQALSPLPKADVLIVTYTVAEGYALADVLAPGWPDSRWTKYQNNWDALKKLVGPRGPSHESDDAAIWAQTTIGSKSVVLVKSSLHPATDGPELPIRLLWKQMIEQVEPDLVITTGTAGAVTDAVLLGDESFPDTSSGMPRRRSPSRRSRMNHFLPRPNCRVLSSETCRICSQSTRRKFQWRLGVPRSSREMC